MFSGSLLLYFGLIYTIDSKDLWNRGTSDKSCKNLRIPRDNFSTDQDMKSLSMLGIDFAYNILPGPPGLQNKFDWRWKWGRKCFRIKDIE